MWYEPIHPSEIPDYDEQMNLTGGQKPSVLWVSVAFVIMVSAMCLIGGLFL